jgi:hypothetical protein
MDFVVSADISQNNSAVKKRSKNNEGVAGFVTLRISVLVILLCFIGQIAGAQISSGTISGRVVDASGGVVANAQVQLTNQDTSVSIATKVLTSGDFFFPDVQPGTYIVSVIMDGYKKLQKKGLRLSAPERLSAGTFQPSFS